MAECIERLSLLSKEEREDLGRNGKKFYENRLSLEKGIEKFDSVFQSLIFENKKKVRNHFLKNIFDYSLTLPGFLVFSPLLVLLTFIIRFRLGAPIFFKQIRPGQHGKPFLMYKFRTMTDERDDKGALLPDDKRLTKFGRFLRSTSLDEIPELLNVLKGDMSLVGPRPLLMEYLERYSPEQARRHEVKPGLTGWAQVNGRNSLSWEEKFALDVWYVDNWSLWLDIKILFLTVLKTLRREGISAEGEATMSRFIGNKEADEK